MEEPNAGLSEERDKSAGAAAQEGIAAVFAAGFGEQESNSASAGARIAELTDEEIAGEEEFLRGVPRMNIGALFMPGIWGPAHGFWVCILFYPLWIFADYMFYGAYAMPDVWTIALAVVTAVLLVAIQVGFALVAGPQSAHRADHKGVSRETYLRRERIWAVVCALIAIAALVWATYYNLEIRTVLK